MEIKKIKIQEIKPNPKNPRFIRDTKFQKLVTSIQEFPEMLQIRPIVVDEDNVVLGGNMRLKACQEAKLKEIYIIKANQLTEKQQREFIIKDNLPYGEWDWDYIANEWDADLLNDWGMEIASFQDSFDDDEIGLGDTIAEKEQVIVNLTMPYYEYENLANDLDAFVNKYPTVVCKIQN